MIRDLTLAEMIRLCEQSKPPLALLMSGAENAADIIHKATTLGWSAVLDATHPRTPKVVITVPPSHWPAPMGVTTMAVHLVPKGQLPRGVIYKSEIPEPSIFPINGSHFGSSEDSRGEG